MDTGTHFVIGLGLGGLALVDPVIASDPYGPIAVLIGTVAGSNAPDLDSALRMKSNADYIKNHRGLSHSLPAIAVWTALITAVVGLLFRTVPWWHIALWVLLAVVVHVATDLTNAYGAQALRPFSKRWIAFSFIHSFDPFIFAMHLLALALWIAGLAAPAAIFPALYAVLIIYFVWRASERRRLQRRLPRIDPEWREGDRYSALPTLSLHRWNVVKLSDDGGYAVGRTDSGQLTWVDRLRCDRHAAVDASAEHPDVRAFLAVTPFPCAQLVSRSWGYEVRWVDIRYQYRRQYPFVAVVVMDRNLQPLQSYVGWLSDERLDKRLRMNSY